MNSELEVLKKIWENNGENYIKLISSQTGFGPDYVRYICKILSKRGEIKSVKKKPGWYRITAKGKKELKSRGIIGAEILRKAGKIKKIVLLLSLKLPKFKFLKSKLVATEEKKLKLGRKIEKAVSFLRRV